MKQILNILILIIIFSISVFIALSIAHPMDLLPEVLGGFLLLPFTFFIFLLVIGVVFFFLWKLFYFISRRKDYIQVYVSSQYQRTDKKILIFIVLMIVLIIFQKIEEQKVINLKIEKHERQKIVSIVHDELWAINLLFDAFRNKHKRLPNKEEAKELLSLQGNVDIYEEYIRAELQKYYDLNREVEIRISSMDKGGYITKVYSVFRFKNNAFIDPWGNFYQYNSYLYSLGEDGIKSSDDIFFYGIY